MTATTLRSPRSASLAATALGAVLLGAATIGLLPGLAAATETGAYIGKSEAEIADSLTQQGYEVRKITREDGFFEVYALRGGERQEIYIDPKTGHMVQTKEAD